MLREPGVQRPRNLAFAALGALALSVTLVLGISIQGRAQTGGWQADTQQQEPALAAEEADPIPRLASVPAQQGFLWAGLSWDIMQNQRIKIVRHWISRHALLIKGTQAIP